MSTRIPTKTIVMSIALSLGCLASHLVSANESVIKETAQDVAKGAKKVARKVDDETCKMVHGKKECAPKKVGNSLKNVGDEVKDKLD